MSNGTETMPGGGLTRRVSGIVEEVQHLGHLQVALVRAEIQNSLHAGKRGVASAAAGGGLLIAAVVLFGIAAAEALVAAAPQLPPGVSHLVVAMVVAAAGAVAIVRSHHHLDQALPGSDRASSRSKEGEL